MPPAARASPGTAAAPVAAAADRPGRAIWSAVSRVNASFSGPSPMRAPIAAAQRRQPCFVARQRPAWRRARSTSRRCPSSSGAGAAGSTASRYAGKCLGGARPVLRLRQQLRQWLGARRPSALQRRHGDFAPAQPCLRTGAENAAIAWPVGQAAAWSRSPAGPRGARRHHHRRAPAAACRSPSMARRLASPSRMLSRPPSKAARTIRQVERDQPLRQHQHDRLAPRSAGSSSG